jgi:hypothetical protein
MKKYDEKIDQDVRADRSSPFDLLEKLKAPEARAAAAGALWQRYRGRGFPEAGNREEAEEVEELKEMVEAMLEMAWESPNTRRMTLALLRSTHGWKRRELAKILKVSIVGYNYVELGRQPLSREGLLKVVTAKEVPERRLREVLLLIHAMTVELATL